jgi:hypothetical protein
MSDRLLTDEFLTKGQNITSADGQFTLIFQDDGNLVIYRNVPTAIWATGTNGMNSEIVVMQADGNLVMYDPNTSPLWDSHTNVGEGQYKLVMQNDGNLVVFDHSNNTIWQSIPPDSSRFPLTAHVKEKLAKGNWSETDVTVSVAGRLDGYLKLYCNVFLSGFKGGTVIFLGDKNGNIVYKSDLFRTGVNASGFYSEATSKIEFSGVFNVGLIPTIYKIKIFQRIIDDNSLWIERLNDIAKLGASIADTVAKLSSI